MRWLSCSSIAAITTVFVAACSGSVEVEERGRGGAGTGGIDAGPDASAACSEDLACQRFPEGDPQCEPGKVAYGCQAIAMVPGTCTFMLPNCVNCVDWCCDEQSSDPPFQPFAVGAPPSPTPPGCTARPDADWICVVQGKPGHAMACDLPLDEPPAASCTGSTYSGLCDADGMFCCE